MATPTKPLPPDRVTGDTPSGGVAADVMALRDALAEMRTLSDVALDVIAAVTASGTLAVETHTPVNATSAAVTMTLPTPTRIGQRIRVEKLDASANAVVVTGTLRGSAGTVTMPFQYEVREFTAESLTSWRVSGGNTPKAALDAYFLTQAAAAGTYEQKLARSGATAGQVPVLQGDGTLVFAAVSGGGTSPDASATTKGLVRLAGHLGGTADNPTVTRVYSKSDVGLGNVDNTTDAAKPISTATQTALNAKADLVGGLVPTSQIPALALTTGVAVASRSAMLALTSAQVQPGDFAVVGADPGKGTYVLLNADPSQLSNWLLLNAPTDVVQSVNGQSGTVVLAKGDFGLGNVANLDPAGLAADAAFVGAYAPRVQVLTAVITSATTLTANRHHLVDASAAAVTVTLPTPTVLGQRIRVEKVDASTNLVGVTGTIRGATATEFLSFQSRTIEYFAESLTSWRVAASHITRTQLDAQYEARVARGTAVAGSVLALQGDGSLSFRNIGRPSEFQPGDHGLISWNYDPGLAGNQTVTTSGVLALVSVPVRDAVTVSNVILNLAGSPSGLTSGQNFAGLYDAAGNLLATTADQTSAWGTSGLKIMALTTPVALQPGMYDIGWFSVATTTPAMSRSGTSTAGNVNLPVASSRYATARTGNTTAMPATTGSKTASVFSWWAALS